MLNKKSLFHFVYAIALVGAIMACIGILNEFLSIAQLYGITVEDALSFKKESYFEPFFFYLLAFLISAGAVTVISALGKKVALTQSARMKAKPRMEMPQRM